MNLKIKGVIVPLLTPFDEGGEVNPAATKRLVEFLIARGVRGLFPAGTTGEGPLLTIQERRQLAKAVVEAADGRVPVIVHAGATTTREAIGLTRHAQDIGAQAAAIIPPYFYQHSDEGLLCHFESVAQQAPDFPIYLYNNPPVSGHDLSAELVTRLVERCPNVVGMKDSSGRLGTLAACASLRDGDFNTANGDDGLILAALAMGFDACVSGNANVVPELVVALYDTVTADSLAEARGLQRKLDAVRQILGDGGGLSLFKGALARRGLDAGGVRAPLLQASEAAIAERWQALNALGLDLNLA
ncbi:MAG: 4-hydroxy-tetrahydrodipicolinate synthase [Anaerolineales bacterium]|nr:4-hydroxy-tetrahydrodipicolinate synthase [Anaerolineales bacterium]